MAYRTPVYSISVKFSCGSSGSIDASSFDVTWGYNQIPQATVLIPLNKFKSSSNVYVIPYEDPSLGGSNPTLADVRNAFSDLDAKCSLSIDIDKIAGTGEDGMSLSLSGWRMTNMAMQPQNNASPGGIVVTIQHPMSKLTASPGFYNPGTANFYPKFVKHIKGANNILEVGDGVLDAIEEALKENERAENIGTSDKLIVEGAGVRLKDYFDIGDCSEFPYLNLFSSNGANGACKKAFGEYFLQATKSGSTPFHGLVSVLNDNAAYFQIGPTDAKATLKVLNPWLNRIATKFSAGSVYEVAMIPDTLPICGIRVYKSSVADNTAESNYTSTKPLAARAKNMSRGDIIFYHQARGNVYPVVVPRTVGRMASLISIYEQNKSNKKGESNTSKDKHRIVQSDSFDINFLLSRGAGKATNPASGAALAKAYSRFAEAQFMRLFKQTARVTVSMAAVESSSTWPKIGDFKSVDVGTGGEEMTGMVTGMKLSGSAGAGSGCILQCIMGYVGDLSSLKADATPRNRLWDAASGKK